MRRTRARLSSTHKVVVAPEADDDLDRLFRHVLESSGSERIAIEYLRRLRKSLESLSLFPERGTRRDDLSPGLRTMGFERRATIAFTVGPAEVRISRVFYGGRDIEAALRD